MTHLKLGGLQWTWVKGNFCSSNWKKNKRISGEQGVKGVSGSEAKLQKASTDLFLRQAKTRNL